MNQARSSLPAHLFSLLLAPLLSACASPPSGGSAAGTGGVSAPEIPIIDIAPQEDPFETSALVPVGKDGKTASIEAPLGPGFEAFVVRTGFAAPVTGKEPCFQLEAVSDADGATWVPPAKTSADWGDYCTTCAQRVAVGNGYGLFAFPNNGSPLPEAASVHFQVALRNCQTRLPFDPTFDGAPPAEIRVETLRVPARPQGARPKLDVFFAFAAGTQFQATMAASDPTLAAARDRLAQALDPANIDVVFTGAADVPSPGDTLSFSEADHAALDALGVTAHKAEIALSPSPRQSLLVVFTPCLVHKDAPKGTPASPEGITAHLPAGFATHGRTDAVFIKGAGCGVAGDYWISGDLLGKVLIHEVGHALGLYHSVEQSGQPDHLADTDANNIMYYAPLLAAAQGLSASQLRVMQTSPLLHD